MFRSQKYPMDFGSDTGNVLLHDSCRVLCGTNLFYHAGKVKCHNKVAAYGSLRFLLLHWVFCYYIICSSFASWRSRTTLLQDLVRNTWVTLLIADCNWYTRNLMANEEKSQILRFSTKQKFCRSWHKIGQKWSELLMLLTLTYSQL